MHMYDILNNYFIYLKLDDKIPNTEAFSAALFVISNSLSSQFI